MKKAARQFRTKDKKDYDVSTSSIWKTRRTRARLLIQQVTIPIFWSERKETTTSKGSLSYEGGEETKGKEMEKERKTEGMIGKRWRVSLEEGFPNEKQALNERKQSERKLQEMVRGEVGFENERRLRGGPGRMRLHSRRSILSCSYVDQMPIGHWAKVLSGFFFLFLVFFFFYLLL